MPRVNSRAWYRMLRRELKFEATRLWWRGMSKTAIARQLGISRVHLYRVMEDGWPPRRSADDRLKTRPGWSPPEPPSHDRTPFYAEARAGLNKVDEKSSNPGQ